LLPARPVRTLLAPSRHLSSARIEEFSDASASKRACESWVVPDRVGAKKWMLPASLANDLFHLHLAAVPLQRFQRLEWSGCAFGIAGGWSGSRCGWGRGGGGFANGFQGFRLFYRIGACRDRRVLRFLNLRWFLRRGRIVIYMESRALEHDGNRLHDSLDSAIGATEAFVQRILGNSLLNFELLVAATALINVSRHRKQLWPFAATLWRRPQKDGPVAVLLELVRHKGFNGP